MVAMVRSVFDLESDAYGTVSSVFAVGSLSGALWAARRKTPRVRTVIIASLLLGLSSLLMAAAPNYPLFALSSIPVGLCVLILLTSANQTIQLTTFPAVRGRVMSIYMMSDNPAAARHYKKLVKECFAVDMQLKISRAGALKDRKSVV